MNTLTLLFALAALSFAVATDESLRICGSKLDDRIQAIKSNCSAETAKFAPLTAEKRAALQKRGIAHACCFSGCSPAELVDLTCR